MKYKLIIRDDENYDTIFRYRGYLASLASRDKLTDFAMQCVCEYLDECDGEAQMSMELTCTYSDGTKEVLFDGFLDRLTMIRDEVSKIDPYK